MLNKEVKVTWLTTVYRPSIDRWLPYIGEALLRKYNKYRVLQQRHVGVIIAITNNIFGKTYAIIDSGDNKIVKMPIRKLTVLHNKKKK